MRKFNWQFISVISCFQTSLRKSTVTLLINGMLISVVNAQTVDVFENADSSLLGLSQCSGTTSNGAVIFNNKDRTKADTMVVLNVVSGRGGMFKATGPDLNIYTFSPYSCNSTDLGKPGQISLRFVDSMAPGFVWNNSSTWKFKTIPSVKVDEYHDVLAPRTGVSAPYAKIQGYREFKQLGEISPTVTQFPNQKTNYVFTDQSAGVKELYIRTDYLENDLNNLILNSSSYLGCYLDSPTRALPVQLMFTGATIETCTAAAKAKGYAYAGLQNGEACFAGDVLGFAKAPSDSDCKIPCTANTLQKCGGSWLNSIYATGITPNQPLASVDLGCYSDNSNRALPVVINSSSSETKETCVAAARARNLLYAGLQFYGQCYAGNKLGYTKITDPTQAATNCNTPCSAKNSENCGGAWFSRIYSTGVTLPAKPLANDYQGCFTDNSKRTLPVTLMPSGATIESCVAAAKAKGYNYAGLQFYGQCFAGDTLPPTKVPDINHSQCNTLCTADQTNTAYCGGGWFNSIWKTK